MPRAGLPTHRGPLRRPSRRGDHHPPPEGPRTPGRRRRPASGARREPPVPGRRTAAAYRSGARPGRSPEAPERCPASAAGAPPGLAPRARRPREADPRGSQPRTGGPPCFRVSEAAAGGDQPFGAPSGPPVPPQRPLGDPAEHQRRVGPAVVGLLNVQDDHPGEEGIAGGGETRKGSGVVRCRVPPGCSLLGGSGLAGNRKPRYRRVAAGPVQDRSGEDPGHPRRRHRSHHPTAGRGRFRCATDPANQTEGHQDAARCDRVDALSELYGGRRDSVAEGDRRQPDRPPGAGPRHDSAALASEREPGRFSKTEGAQVPTQRFGPEPGGHLERADVRRALDDSGEGERAERFPVADDPRPDAVAAVERVEFLVLVRHPLVERSRRGEDLEDGAGLVGIGDGPVDQRSRRIPARPIRIERRRAGHREDLTGHRLDEDHGAGGGRKLGDAPVEFLFRDRLQVGIDRQLDVRSRPGLPHHPAPPPRPPPVGPDGAASRLAPERLVERELNAAQTVVVHPHEAHRVRRERAAGVVAAVLLDRPQRKARFFGAGDFTRFRLPLQPRKERVAPQAPFDEIRRHSETGREALRRFRYVGRGVVGRDHVHRVDRDRQRQRPPVAVIDASPERRNGELVPVLTVGPPHHRFVIQDLDLDQLTEDQRRPNADQDGPHDHAPADTGGRRAPPATGRSGSAAGRRRWRWRSGRTCAPRGPRRCGPGGRRNGRVRKIGEEAVRRPFPAAGTPHGAPRGHGGSVSPRSPGASAGAGAVSSRTRSAAGSRPWVSRAMRSTDRGSVSSLSSSW